MCSAHAGELTAPALPPDFIGTCSALLDADFVVAAGGIADPRFAGYGSEDVDLCWRIGEHGGQVARTAAVYVHHHFHDFSLINNEVDGEAELRTGNQILYGKWGPKLIALAQAEIQSGGSLAGVSERAFHLPAAVPPHDLDRGPPRGHRPRRHPRTGDLATGRSLTLSHRTCTR